MDRQNPLQGHGRLALCCYPTPDGQPTTKRVQSTSRHKQNQTHPRVFSVMVVSRGGRSFFAAAKTAGLTFGMARRARSFQPPCPLSLLASSLSPSTRVLIGTLLFSGSPKNTLKLGASLCTQSPQEHIRLTLHARTPRIFRASFVCFPPRTHCCSVPAVLSSRRASGSHPPLQHCCPWIQ